MRRFTVWFLVTSLIAGLLAATPGPAAANPSLQAARNLAQYSDVLDVGKKLRAELPTKDLLDVTGAPAGGSAAADQAGGAGTAATEPASYGAVGDQLKMLALNDYTGRYYFKLFTLRAIGTHGEIWVANDVNFPTGDPRNPVTVTDEQINYLLNQFDSNIYPKEKDFFGTPDTHTGANSLLSQWGLLPPGYYQAGDGSARVMILVDNIRDDNYYASSYPLYIAGFFSPSIEAYLDRNVITIDAYDWADRVGPNTAPWRGADQSKWKSFLYEGVFAHEFQHLIHSDLDPAEETWINEGMSDFAQYLTGYGHSDRHVQAFQNHPRNSLVVWEDQGDLEILADYGIAYLFQLYLAQHYGGGPFIQALAHNTHQGIQSVNETLAQFRYKKTFADVFRDFSLAVLIDAPKLKKGAYHFPDLDINVAATPEPGFQYQQNGAPPWGTDYTRIDHPKQVEHISFNGIEFLPSPWQVLADPLDPANKVLWGNTGNLADNFLILPLDLTAKTSATLSFDTLFDIEEAWDYGVVQVSTDQGQTWTSLANADTRSDVDPSGHPKVKANVPGFTGVSLGPDGVTPAWTSEAFDLTPWAGRKILVSFRYLTDWAAAGNGALATPGWYLDNIKLDGTLLSDGSSLLGFLSLDQVLKNYVNYMLSFVGVRKDHDKSKYKVKTLDIFNVSQQDKDEVKELLEDAATDYAVMLVTFAAPQDVSHYADYSLQVQYDEEKEHRKEHPKDKQDD